MSDELRDTEIEDLGRAGRRHQNVAGLQIAMDDRVLVRILHGSADALKEPEPIVERNRAAFAVARDRHAIDELHHEEGLARVCEPAVEERDDVRVVQRGEDLPLGSKPPQRVVVSHRQVDQLHCRALREPSARPHAGVHRPHASLADPIGERESANRQAEESILGRVGPERRGTGGFEKLADGVGGFEQGLHFGAQIVPVAASLGEPLSSLRRGSFGNRGKDLLDFAPEILRHGELGANPTTGIEGGGVSQFAGFYAK